MIDQIAKLNLSYFTGLSLNIPKAVSQNVFLQKFLVEEKCTFKDKPMPTLLKPNFISPKQTQTLQYAVENICNALTKFIDLYLQNENVRAKMKFSDLENELFFVDPGYKNPLVISRLDAFLDDCSVKFLEFNCDSPAGKAYADVLEKGFKEIFKEYDFFQDWKIEYFKRQERLLAVLLTCYNEFHVKHTHMPTKPTIAIVDWDDVSTVSEFELLQTFFEEHGYKTVITSPLKFSVVGDKAFADGEEVHLIYKRVITRELLARYNEVQGFIECIKKGLACVCNSFRSYIVGNKKVLALLTDPEFQDIYTEDELKVIKQTVPWTKILADDTVKFKEYTVHLKDFVLDNKDKLVLKPANSYGGKDVHLGNETDQAVWEKVIYDNIKNENWVVQEFVNIPQEFFPIIDTDVSLMLKKVNINPFALLGKYGGTITRVSDASVINVSAGGGLVPTLTACRKKDIVLD